MSRKDQTRFKKSRHWRTRLEPHVSKQQLRRTLKPSVRRKLERERAPSLWQRPWVSDLDWRAGRVYEEVSLLGLPAELRQRSLYLSLSIPELKDIAKDDKICEVRTGLGERRGRPILNALNRRVGEL